MDEMELYLISAEAPKDLKQADVNSVSFLTSVPLEQYYFGFEFVRVEKDALVLQAITLELAERRVLLFVPIDLVYLLELETDDASIRADFSAVSVRRQGKS